MTSRWVRAALAAVTGAALAVTLMTPTATAGPTTKQPVSGKAIDVTGGEQCQDEEDPELALQFSGDMEGCWYVVAFDDLNNPPSIEQSGNGVWKGTGRVLFDRFVGTVHGVPADITFTGEAYGYFRGASPLDGGTPITGGCTHHADPGQGWAGTVYIHDLYGQGNFGDGRYHGKLASTS